MTSFTNPNADVLLFNGRTFEFNDVLFIASKGECVEMKVRVLGKDPEIVMEHYLERHLADDRVTKIRKVMDNHYERKGGLPMVR